MTTIAELCVIAEELWPASGAESWDVTGLVVGSAEAPVRHIRLAVDVTPDVIADARDDGVDFLIAHHPLLLRGATTIAEQTYKGACLVALVRSNVGLLTAHTNADVVESGVSDVLAGLLELGATSPIVPAEHDPHVGIGRVGTLPVPLTLGELAKKVAGALPATAQGIRASGDFDRSVTTVALCGGAGDSLLAEPLVRQADVFITSDLRHHPASEFREWAKLNNGPALVDVSHWASEWMWLDVAADQIRSALPGVTVSVSDVRTDPWDFVVVQ